jgi:uncharacterized RDD family membrane protein YckC
MQNSTFVVATPSLKRRFISMIYETLLLTAVEFLAVTVYLLLTLNAHSAVLDAGRSMVVVLAAAAYFIVSWCGSGHTLAMKTWRIKLIKVGTMRVPPRAAAIRFVCAWGAIAPALLIIHGLGLMTSRTGTWSAMVILLVNVVAWSLTALFDKDRQFLHDRIAGTRLIELPKRSKKSASEAEPA